MIPDDDKYKVKIAEMLKGRVDWDSLEPEIKQNLIILRDAISTIRMAWGRPMAVSSGLRTMEDHLRIYREKGITNKRKIPMRSKHLYGQAVDIRDPNGELQEFLKLNQHLLRWCDLWCEDFSYTPGWVHLQCAPYGSWVKGKSRFFKP